MIDTEERCSDVEHLRGEVCWALAGPIEIAVGQSFAAVSLRATPGMAKCGVARATHTASALFHCERMETRC